MVVVFGFVIYNYIWLVLMLLFGMIGVMVLIVVMLWLSCNVVVDDILVVFVDLLLVIRLIMIMLILMVVFMMVGGLVIGSVFFVYGNFGDVDVGYLGVVIVLLVFMLIFYVLVLL